jgi:hypothetical protein
MQFFMGGEFSFLGLLFAILLVQFFTILFPIIIIFIGSFYIFPSHWIEPVIRFFIVLIHYGAKYSHGTFLSATFMLLSILWILLLNKNLKWILLCLLLHSELAATPIIFVQGSTPLIRSQFVHK